MVEQICPRCGAPNGPNNRFCGQCGAPMQSYPLVPGRQDKLAIARDRLFPAASLQQVGRAVAVSLAALAAEAGLAWLRRRMARLQVSQPAAPEKKTEMVAVEPARPVATIFRHRVLRVWQHGRLLGQAVEETVWTVEE